MSISSSFICLNIEKWYASSVGLNDRQAWQDWALNGQYPENSETIFTNIPAMMRRRMSELSKHAVHSALELLSQTSVDYMVFSSRHGELHRSIALVKDILLGEEASPMAFSQSVHNTAAGLATIASKKSIPLTSIAAGENTFHSALIETFCYLQQHPDKKVLLVDFDEPLPEDYAEFEEQSYRGYALALVISQGEQFTISQAAPSVDPVTPRPQALQFFATLSGEFSSHMASFHSSSHLDMATEMRKIGQYWRIVATGFCFAMFGIGGLALSFVVIPLIHLLEKDQTRREYRVQNTIQITFNLLCKLMKYTGAIDYKITGADILASDKNCLIIANHPSLIDYVLIASQLPQCDCLVKAAIWDNPFMKHVVKGAGYIPNKSPDELLNQCEQRFARGNVLLVFPEGTRTTPGIKSSLQRGAAQVAVRTERDMRVVHITVTPSFLTKEKKWYQVPETKPFFHIEVKHKVEVKPFIEQTSNPTSAARRLNQHLAKTIFPS